MKKDNKRKTQNGPISTTPPKSDSHSAGTITKMEETEIKKLTIAEKIAIAGVIVTVIGIGVTLLIRWIDSPNRLRNQIESLTESINNSTFKIEESFKFNAIKIDSLSSPDKKYVKAFQDATVRLASEWKSMSTSPSISEFESLDSYGLIGVAESQLDNRERFNNERDTIMDCIENILNYGKQNDIKFYIPQNEKMVLLQILESKRDDNISSERARIKWMKMKMIIDSGQNSKNNDKSWIIDELKNNEKTRNSKNNLKYIDSLFATIIELNERYMIHIKQLD